MSTIILYIAIILLLIVIALLVTSLYRTSKAKSELEYKNLILRINPHFIFNSLTAIQNYILTNEIENANRYLSGLSRMIRMALDNSRNMKITLDKEVTFLKHFLDMQSMRFEGRFKYSLYVDKEINSELVLVPPMLILPFIENIAEHGHIRFSDNGELNISFRKVLNTITIEIEDICVDYKVDAKEVERSVMTSFDKAYLSVNERIIKYTKVFSNKIVISVDHLKSSIHSKNGMVIRLSYTI